MNRPWKYASEYASIALWKAFDIIFGKVIDLTFKVPHDQIGLSYDAFRIEETANTPDARLLIEDEYRSFMRS